VHKQKGLGPNYNANVVAFSLWDPISKQIHVCTLNIQSTETTNLTDGPLRGRTHARIAGFKIHFAFNKDQEFRLCACVYTLVNYGRTKAPVTHKNSQIASTNFNEPIWEKLSETPLFTTHTFYSREEK
jgi:hypothetical protein